MQIGTRPSAAYDFGGASAFQPEQYGQSVPSPALMLLGPILSMLAKQDEHKVGPDGKVVPSKEEAEWQKQQDLIKAKHNLEMKAYEVQNPKPVTGINKGQGYTLLGLGLLQSLLDPKGVSGGALVSGAAQGMQTGINAQNQNAQTEAERKRQGFMLQAHQTGEDASLAGQSAQRYGVDADRAEALAARVAAARADAKEKELDRISREKIADAVTERTISKQDAANWQKQYSATYETYSNDKKYSLPMREAARQEIIRLRMLADPGATADQVDPGAPSATLSPDAKAVNVGADAKKSQAQTAKQRADAYEKVAASTVEKNMAMARKADRGPVGKSGGGSKGAAGKKPGDERIRVESEARLIGQSMDGLRKYDNKAGKYYFDSQEDKDTYEILKKRRLNRLSSLGSKNTGATQQAKTKSTVETQTYGGYEYTRSAPRQPWKRGKKVG